MAYSLTFILRKQKQRPDGTCPVWLRVTANRKSRYRATGIYLEPKHWNATKQQVRRTHPLADRYNGELKSILHKATEVALEARTTDGVLGAVKEYSGSLSEYFRQFTDNLDRQGRFWDWKKYCVTLGKLEEALGEGLAFSDLDRSAMIRFERYLKEKKGNAPNTVRKELSRLRTVLRHAVKDGAMKPAEDPFLVYDRPKGERVDRRKLSLEEIGKLAALELDFGSLARTARDAFLFSFYAAGARFSDVVLLKASGIRDGRLEYRMEKTGHLVSLPLPEPALEILQPYLAGLEADGSISKVDFVFGLLRPGEDADPVKVRRRISSRNTQVNEQLKALAAQAEIKQPETISFHVARHSFADFARTKSGNLYAISKALGHSSLSVTQQYLKSFDRQAVDDLTAELWG